MTISILNRFVIKAIAVIATFTVCGPALSQSCQSVPHAADDHYELNQFWGTQIPLCRLPAGTGNAYANRNVWAVFADQDWLDEIAEENGSWAATGILAHEWGHMVQGNVGGTASELQADCLAGIFMRGRGLPQSVIEEFASLNLKAGDPAFSFAGHGLGIQRYNAAMRGYIGFASFNGFNLLEICPLSAF